MRRYRAIQSIFVGLLIDLTYELVKSIWQNAKKDHEDAHERKRSELSKRGGTDQWEASNN